MWKPWRRKRLSPPDSVPIDNTSHEEVIEKIFALATQKADGLENGTTFEVTLQRNDVPNGFHHMQVAGPIVMRSIGHGLMPETCRNRTFRFTKI